MSRHMIVQTSSIFAALALVTGVGLSVQAEEKQQSKPGAESTIQIDQVLPKNQVDRKPAEADVDEVITNRKLRAETGSKSKYSFSAALSYSGGTINDPGSATRPNIAAGTATPTDPALGGSLGIKYKLSTLQSLSLDVGMLSRKPFHGDDRKNLRERTTVSNPSLTYQTLYKMAGVQNVTSLSGTFMTDDYYRKLGYQYGASFGQTAIYDFGGSQVSVGLAITADVNAFDKNDAALQEQQGDYSFAFYPFAEYVFSDKLNLRTVLRPFTFEHVRSEPFGNVIRNVFTQSVGMGISVSRDVYLYPNIQFVPENLSAELTNVGLTANINI